MAHSISVPKQAMRLFIIQWFNGFKPSLHLSTKSDGSILMISEVASFSALLQVPLNDSHHGCHSGNGAWHRQRNTHAASSSNKSEGHNFRNNCSSSLEQNQSRLADQIQGSSVACFPTVFSTPQKLQSEQAEHIDAPRDLMNIPTFFRIFSTFLYLLAIKCVSKPSSYKLYTHHVILQQIYSLVEIELRLSWVGVEISWHWIKEEVGLS